ncbi:MAG: hypothetical protein VKL01_09925 [Limnothrix sp.]|nr:hypothetical protein [Limnothrix sp. FACHB-881]MEB3118671.1 hypothetical protein [Limnothrix sp.]
MTLLSGNGRRSGRWPGLWGVWVALGLAIALMLRGPAIAQLPPSTNDVWRQVYQVLPDIPREDHYINRESREVDRGSSLLARMIRYHVYQVGRSPFSRLDWKLTLADYLGLHQYIPETSYPGNERLTENPLDGDQAAVRRLNRAQRDRLVNTLVILFDPNGNRGELPTATPGPTNTPRPTPVQPRPGSGADLLRL